MDEPEYWSRWFVAKFKHSVVTDVALRDDLVTITRDEAPPVTAVALGNERITARIVTQVLASAGTPPPAVIVQVPSSGHYDWSAREVARRAGSIVLTMAELGSALIAPDPRTHVDKHVGGTRARLVQHSKVRRVEMLCESSMRVVREAGMGDVVVAVINQYDLSLEGLQSALARHPDADVVMNANAYGRVTSAAREHARHADVAVFTGRELMGALNYTGARFMDYTSPPPTR